MSEPIDTSVIIYIRDSVSPAAVRIIEQGVRAVTGGVIDLVVQVELENFCNTLRAQIQRNEANVRKDQLAAINAEYHANKEKPGIIHIVVGEALQQTFDDLL